MARFDLNPDSMSVEIREPRLTPVEWELVHLRATTL